MNPFSVRVAAAVLLAAAAFTSHAQEWPTKPIRFLWPYSPGSANGQAAKTMMEEVGRLLGQPVITDYKPGAGGRFPLLELKHVKRDDYLVASAQDVIYVALPLLSSNFKLEPGRDYKIVSQTHELEMALTGSTKLPFKDFEGLIAYAKANPGKLTFGTSGPGGATHLYSERIWAAAGIKLLHIPYKGTSQALVDRITGAVDLYLTDLSNKPQVDAGQMVVLATTGPKRSIIFPQAKNLRESGLDMVMLPWGGIAMPPETPDAIVQKLNRAVNAVLARTEIKKLYSDLGYTALGSTPEDLEKRIRVEAAEYAKILKPLNLVLD